MTDDSNPVDDVADRKDVLALLEDGIREAHRKVESGRVYDPESEKIRIQWIRCLAYAAGQYRQLKNDEDLEQMQAEIDLLKDANGLTDDD